MLKFGGVEAIKEDYRAERGLLFIENLLQDARYALRSLRRTPGLTAFVVIPLALGIAMTSSVFGMVDALIFRPYPVPHPSGVVTLVSTTRDNSFEPFSYREYLDIRANSHSFDGVIANADMEPVGFSAEPTATPRIKGGMMVSGGYFHVLGVEPQRGWAFREDEDQVPGRDAVVVLRPDFWKPDRCIYIYSGYTRFLQATADRSNFIKAYGISWRTFPVCWFLAPGRPRLA